VCRLCVTTQLNWTKNTWCKSMVQGGAETDAKRSYADLVTLLRQHASSSPGGVSGAPQGSSAAPEGSVGTAAGAAAGVLAPKAVRGSWLQGGSVVVVLRVALVLAVLLLAWAVLSAGRSISVELRSLAAVMEQCRTVTGGQGADGLPGLP
jgi:hypothetical protein